MIAAAEICTAPNRDSNNRKFDKFSYDEIKKMYAEYKNHKNFFDKNLKIAGNEGQESKALRKFVNYVARF